MTRTTVEGFDLDTSHTDTYGVVPVPESYVHTVTPDDPDDPGDCPADGCQPMSETADWAPTGERIWYTEYACGHYTVEPARRYAC